MNLDAALKIATGGLANINRQMALVSQNVANASTPDYAAAIGTQYSLTAGGQGFGVMTGATTRAIDTALQSALYRQDTTVAALRTTQTALQAIDSVHGTPGQGGDLSSLLGALHDQVSSLLGSPDNQAQQSRVVTAAAALAAGLNRLSDTVTTQRQAAHDDTAGAVAALNQALATIGSVSTQIVGLKAGGKSTADLENQRDAAVHALAQLVDVRTFVQPNGDMQIVTASGLALPTRSLSAPLSVADAGLQPGAWYPGGGVPGIMLGGIDVTSQLQGGRIGADIALRDRTLPTYQAELDEFAQTLAGRFDAQGLTLFTDPTGAVPAGGGVPAQSGYVGFAATIQVNAAVAANPSLVRDGTTAIAGSPTGASAFTPNPPGGPAGFTGMITRILTNALGAEAQGGVPHPASNTSGLGPAGNLAAPYAAPPTLAGLAATLVASQAQDSANVATQVGTETAMRDSLSARLSAGSGVDMDAEMSLMITLQTAYGANARIISAAQAMFTQLMNAVQ